MKAYYLLLTLPLLVLGCDSSQTENTKQDSTTPVTKDKQLFQGKHLKFVGGYRIPLLSNIGNINMKWSELPLDNFPGSDKWLTSHPAGYVVELQEPSQGLSTAPASSDWPEMSLLRSHVTAYAEGVYSKKRVAAFYLNEDSALVSARQAYRTGFVEGMMSVMDLTDGSSDYYSIYAEEDSDAQANFYVMNSTGSGFTRVYDQELQQTLADGNPWLIGRGGYDVLNSSLGPALASWSIGDLTANFLMAYSSDNPAKRDPFYLYANLDPNTNNANAQLAIWKDAQDDIGYWQAGDVGQVAIINHPDIKGVVSTVMQARGVLDYRAQGDTGSGSWFAVKDPALFYSEDSCCSDRYSHEGETLNQAYGPSTYARVLYVADPDDLQAVKDGLMLPYEVSHQRYEFPQEHIDIWTGDDAEYPTRILGFFWDNSRQYLWVALDKTTPILVAYELINDVDELNLAQETPISPPSSDQSAGQVPWPWEE